MVGLMLACAAQGYRLVVTGHSLGAGAAALISLKLRDRFEGETLQLRSPCVCATYATTVLPTLCLLSVAPDLHDIFGCC